MSSEQRYKAKVPDTLDLAERAALSVNALTGAVDPEHSYETYHCAHIDHNPPYMNHRAGGPCHSKVMHVLPLMRLVSGSTQNVDYDDKMLEFAIQDVEDDGLWWLKMEGRPWRQEVYGEDFIFMTSQVRLIDAMMDRYKLDGDSRGGAKGRVTSVAPPRT